MASNAGKYYVVWVGRHPGVYDNWADAKEQIESFPGALFKGFKTKDAAVKAFRSADNEAPADVAHRFITAAKERMSSPRPRQKAGEPIDFSAFPEIDPLAIAVDASCLGNPGKMEYRGVEVATGREVFRLGPLEGGTNNIGEFLAIVHALALLKQQGSDRTIYSDSRTAMSWIRKGHSNTKLIPTRENHRVVELLVRANTWIANHTWPNRIVKWETERWGEIPADFDRK